jgi:hypothetical protein
MIVQCAYDHGPARINLPPLYVAFPGGQAYCMSSEFTNTLTPGRTPGDIWSPGDRATSSSPREIGRAGERIERSPPC